VGAADGATPFDADAAGAAEAPEAPGAPGVGSALSDAVARDSSLV
jgi:hypothetical protein